MRKEITYKEFNPYKKLFFANFLLTKLRMSPKKIGIIAFLGYYIGTMLISLFNKVLLSKKLLDNYLLPDDLKNFLNSCINPQCTLAFFDDLSHFLFSLLVILPGCIIGAYFLKKMPLLLCKFVENNIIISHQNEVNKLFNRFQLQIDNIFARVLILLVSLAGFCIFILLTNSDNFITWWGCSEYGIGGIYLAVLISIILYHAIFVMYVSCLFVIFLKKMMSLHIKLRPFHYDACNGYGPLGRIILILFGISIVIAVAVFIVLFWGFLNLQKTIFIWLLILGCIMITPLLIFLPSYYVVCKIKSEKNKLLQTMESRINKITMELEKPISDQKISLKKIDDLLKIKELFNIYNGITIWPYNIKFVLTILITYLFQIVLFLYEAIKT